MSAFIADVKMVTESPGATVFDVGHDGELFLRQLVPGSILPAVAPEYVGKFRAGTF